MIFWDDLSLKKDGLVSMLDPDPKLTAQNLVALRESLGLTQAQVADAMGVARNRLSTLEKGQARVLTNQLVEPLADLYGVQVKNMTRTLIVKPGFDKQCLPELFDYLPDEEKEWLIIKIRACVVKAHGGEAAFISKVVIRE